TVMAEGDNVGFGGATTLQGSNVLHIFTATGPQSLFVPGAVTANVLLVAGGGGGGGGTGGGGGAGGFVTNPSFAIGAGTTAVTVGAGGLGGSGFVSGSSGGNSTLGALSATGGGA